MRKVFLVLMMMVSVSVVTQAQAGLPAYAIVGVHDEPEVISISGDAHSWMGLSSGFHEAYKLSPYTIDGEGNYTSHSGYVLATGGPRDVLFETLLPSTGSNPVIDTYVQTYDITYGNSTVVFSNNQPDGWREDVFALEFIYATGSTGYSFMGYHTLGSGTNFPSIYADQYIIPIDGNSFIAWLDVDSPNHTDFGYKVTFGDLTSPVPEPETYAMLLVGLGLIGFTVRNRRRVTHDNPGWGNNAMVIA